LDPTAVATNWNKKKNELTFKGPESLDNLTKFYADFCFIMKKLNVVDGKTLANEFQAKLPVNFQSMIYKTKMFNQGVEDSAEKLFKLLCLHLNDPAYKSENPKNSDKKKDFKRKFEKFEKSDDKQKKQEKGNKTHLKCDSCGKTGHVKEDCFRKCSICSKAGHNSKNCSQIKKS
jgi:hypothetical protein